MANVAGIPVWREIGASARASREPLERHAVVVVGAGPVGLALALDLGRRGHRVVVLSRLDFVAAGSKAICFSKRSLDIFDRLGVGQAMVDRGVTWNVGKVFWGADSEPVYRFDVLPVKDQQRPGFINLQQYHVEDILIDALQRLPNVDLRWGHRLTAVAQGEDAVEIAVRSAHEEYRIRCQWLAACDGSRSTVRDRLGLDFEGRVFEDNFLIADVRMDEGEGPAERWFWFDPPFNPGQSALMHKQPDGVWRLDFQLGWDIDRAAAAQPENVERYVRAMLGPRAKFRREWYSVYTFQCRRMQRFVHGRVLFAGDSAHLVSPFGARGCNGGLADADNLGWKLDRVLRGAADAALLHSYDFEAVLTADENIAHSSRSTDFMTPKCAASRAYRDAVLELARDCAFARPLVNSGRLSTAVSYPDSPLNTADADDWDGGVAPGSPALDAPLGEGWLLRALGDRFVLLADGWRGEPPQDVELYDLGARAEGLDALRARYALRPGSAYLIRPDHYVCARWRRPDRVAVAAALARAQGRPQ
ncbi:FAD-dependent oxidoreductase [Lysobacter enzymogenes]|uniref:FAD-dependent oxidoreductase n=1 Tax=Lysobacter enzymogenes TaxID=69 RepID=UPI001AF65325|nr:FAD-dependent oxidoreductase [Lysobacter enzymogenes]QQQ01441.1 FAD-dependent oxidoreductase [Lysobacter enzymogenes]